MPEQNYTPVGAEDTPNSGRSKWNSHIASLDGRTAALEDAPAEVLVQDTEPEPGQTKLWVNTGADPVTVNYFDGEGWSVASGGPSGGAGEQPEISSRRLTVPTGDDFGIAYAGVRFTRTAPVYIAGIDIRYAYSQIYRLSLYNLSSSTMVETLLHTSSQTGGQERILFSESLLLDNAVEYELGLGSESERILASNSLAPDTVAPFTLEGGLRERGTYVDENSLKPPAMTFSSGYYPAIDILYHV